MKRTTIGLAVLAIVAGAVWAAGAFDARRRPFTLTLSADGVPNRQVVVYDLDPVRARRFALSTPSSRARWEGAIELPDDEGTYDVTIVADSPTSLAFERGRGLLEHGGRPGRVTGTLRLSRRQPVAIEHALRADGDTSLRLTVARAAGGEPQRLETLSRNRSQWLSSLRPWAGLVAWIAALVCAVRVWPAFRTSAPDTRARVRRWTWHAAAVLVTLYGGLLRVEALASMYPDAPAWMSDLVPVAQALHPRGMKWLPPEHPYQGDPFSYLRLARETRGFYAPSVREPLFVHITAGFLKLLGGRDVAVSTASCLFSILLIPATYLLGLVAFSPAVGLVAAAALAVERQLIGLGVEGWRDDAFAFFVVLSAAAVVRLYERGSSATTIAAGLVLGGAMLTRITSLSFAVPALAVAALLGAGARKKLWARVAAAAGLAALLIAPFLIACWREYGDPLYSINAHTRFYRSRAAGSHESATAWHSFLMEGRGPFAFLDTGLVGLTSYPFTNKWEHFDYLGTWLGPLLATASVIGLLLWPFLARGRLLLVILFASLLPYAFTWDIPGGSEWRFTLHAYPLYLLAAASAPALAWTAARWLRARWTSDRGRTALLTAAAIATAVVFYVSVCALAWARVHEDLAAGRPATIAAGPRDIFFMGRGWSWWPRRRGHVLVRRGDSAADVRLPLRVGSAHRIKLRLDPHLDGRSASLSLNGEPLSDVALTRDPDRFGRYEVEIPTALVRRSANVLHIRSDTPFDLWLVHIEPQ